MSAPLTKASMGYEGSVPRCGTCIHWTRPTIVAMRESMPTWSVPWCELGGFSAKQFGICDHWTSSRGDRLVDGVKAPAEAQAAVVPAEAQA